MQKANVFRNYWTIARVWISIIVAIWLGSHGSLVGMVCSIIFIGAMQYHLNILGHDGIHYLIDANRKTNDFITRWFLICPQGMPLKLMRRNHLNHHLRLGEVLDADRQYYNMERFRSKWTFSFWLVFVLLGGMAAPIAQKLVGKTQTNSMQKIPNLGNQYSDFLEVAICHGIIFLTLWLTSGYIWGYFVFWVVPLFTIMVGLNSIRSCLEHAVGKNESYSTRLFSFKSNAIERFFLAPYNMNYHAEHHTRMNLPFRSLPNLRSKLLKENVELIVWKSYWHRYRLLCKNFY